MSNFLRGATYVLWILAFLSLFQPNVGVLLAAFFGFAAAVCYGFAVRAVDNLVDGRRGRTVPETRAPAPGVRCTGTARKRP